MALEPVYENLERFALNLARNRDLARDIVGETVLRACENYSAIRSEKALLSYLFTTAGRIYYSMAEMNRRSAGAGACSVEELFGGGIAPDDELEIQMLYDAMDKLEERQREALLLAEIMGFKLKEVAEIQGTSVANVKVRVHRAKKALKQILGAEENHKRFAVGEIRSKLI